MGERLITHYDRYGDHGPGGGVVTFVSEKGGLVILVPRRGGVCNFPRLSSSFLAPPHVNNEHSLNGGGL